MRKWKRSGRLADSILHDLLSVTALGPPDRAFATELFYGVLRHLRLLDFWIASLTTTRIEDDIADVLRLGIYQLLLLETAEHAAIYETVELAHGRARGAVNAILRSAQRRKLDLRTAAGNASLALRESHPDFLLERWTSRLGASAAEKLCAWNNEPPPLYVRVNQLRISTAHFRAAHSDGESVAGYPNFLRFSQLPYEALNAGQCYVQDPSTTIACELLAPQPGERVLDTCAAPGGKTGYLAELMQNSGSVIAADREVDRLRTLRANLENLGVSIATGVRCDWAEPALLDELHSGRFDRILVDAPCSNTGVMRRRVDARWRLRPDDFRKMQREQLAIVRGAMPFLRPGGVLVYSTCSIELEENEEVVSAITNEFPQLRLERMETRLPFRDGVDGAFAARFVSAL